MWSRNLTRQFLFFTTYLYQTLLQEKSKNINCRGTYSFKSVESWTNNLINDTNLAKLFIPINLNNIHWVLIVVDIIERSIHYYDSCHAGRDEQLQRLKNRKNCQNVITKLDYQFMDLTDKGLFLMSVKNPVKLDLLFRVSSLKTKNVFLTVTKLITFFGITPILFLLSECHH